MHVHITMHTTDNVPYQISLVERPDYDILMLTHGYTVNYPSINIYMDATARQRLLQVLQGPAVAREPSRDIDQ